MTQTTPLLPGYAAFVLKAHLDDFVKEELELLRSFDLPLLRRLAPLGEEAIYALTKDALARILEGLATGRVLEVVAENLKSWENNQLPVQLQQTDVALTDLMQGYAAQRRSLLSFLPDYTDSVPEATAIAQEMEQIYLQMQQMALEVLGRITQRYRDELNDSEEKYRDLFDHATDIIHMVSPDGTIMYVNNAWLNTLGYESGALVGRSIYDFVRPDLREAYRRYRGDIMAGRTQSLTDTVFITAHGAEVALEGSVACTYRDGQPYYTRCILRNVTETRRQAADLQARNELLSEQNEYIDRLVRQAPDAVIVIDEQSRIVLWNEKAESIFGWKEAEVLQQPLSATIIPEAYREGHERGIARYLQTGVPHVIGKTIELTALDKSGREFPVSLTVSAYRRGGRQYFISFIRDNTEQRRAAAILEEQRQQLEQSNKELEQYAWLASHDLKEPLRKVSIFTDALRHKYATQLPEEGRHLTTRIHDATLRMIKLVDSVRTYTQVSMQETVSRPTDLNRLMTLIASDLELAISEKNAVLEIGHLPLVSGDATGLRQLFQNLVANALKYSKPDVAPVIEIAAAPFPKPGIAAITVSDNGIGFDQQYAERIFQIFQRLETGGGHEGTGIGLALCRKIVTQHGGSISAASVPGVGSAFMVTLPLAL